MIAINVKNDEFAFEKKNFYILGDSGHYMPPILVPSSAKRVATQILVIAKSNQRKDFILRVFVCGIIHPSKNLFKVSNLSTRIRSESCLTLRMSMLTIFNINNVSGIAVVSLLLTVNIFQTLF